MCDGCAEDDVLKVSGGGSDYGPIVIGPFQDVHVSLNV